MLMASTVLLVGCGGGGGASTPSVVTTDGDSNPPEVLETIYINQKLPVIQENSIPDTLLEVKTSNSKKTKKQYKEIGELSSGYTQLKIKAAFFYKKQLQMNLELGYMDSIWGQIESYCNGKDICNVPSGKITFTYTNALYKRDIELITKYEEKTGIEYQNNGILKEDLKTIIGQSAKLSSAKLVTDDVAEYKYVLSTEQLGDQEENPNSERSIAKWNDDNNNYLMRVEIGETNGEISYSQFEYIEIDEEKRSRFTSNHQGFYDESLEFKEKEDGSIYFVQDNPDDFVTYHAEGFLNEEGGKMTFSDTEGYYLYETFGKDGNILTTISCHGVINNPQEISDTDSCSIQDPSIIKKILVDNIYSLSQLFWDVSNALPTSGPEHQTMLKFDENNSLLAIVDCTTFNADYNVEEYGISFSNIKKIIATDLKCLYPQIQDNFETVINKGLPFMNAVDNPVPGKRHFNTLFGFFPNLGSVSRADFNLTKFIEKLHADKYVDSPLMNSVFKIKSIQDYYHKEGGKRYLLIHTPNIKIEKKKIIIDLLDATFDADIIVLDPTHIKFVNINRVKKSNVSYPADKTNSDKVFTNVIEEFLNETIEVSLATTDYAFITFSGTNLTFRGSTIPVKPVVKSLRLTVGDKYTESVYSPHETPIVLLDGTKDITNVSINKEGNIELQGADANLFSLSNNQLSFAVEVNASNPIDANEDGIYELEIVSTDNDGQTVRYDVWYKVYIPGTIIVHEVQDMVGVWDFSEGYNRIHYKEIRENGSIQIYDYDDARKCYDIVTSAIAIRKGAQEGIFEEYDDINKRISSSFAAEILNNTLIRTHINNLSEFPKINRVLKTAAELMQQECP